MEFFDNDRTRIEEAIKRLLIQSDKEIKTRIEEVKYCIDIPETNSKCYCYCLKVDGNGNLRLKDLVDYIDTRIVDYAIPKQEIDSAREHFIKSNSTRKIVELQKKAKHLFTDLKATGEGGEILLYILAQDILELPQLISKMSLKTSSKMHYHGADGVHFEYNKETGNLNLYWAESKMYNDLKAAIKNCLDSLKSFLLDPQGYGSAQERDIELITSNISQNINDTELEDILVEYFDKDKESSNHLIYKGLCFIGFDFDKYPSETCINKTTEDIKNAIITVFDEWNKFLRDKLKSHDTLDQKEIHVFLMPFPSVEKFREYYLQMIK